MLELRHKDSLMWAKILGLRERNIDVKIQVSVHSNCDSTMSRLGAQATNIDVSRLWILEGKIGQCGCVLGQGPLLDLYWGQGSERVSSLVSF